MTLTPFIKKVILKYRKISMSKMRRKEQIYMSTAKMLKAISDPKRLRIVDMLSCGELCACKILEMFHITQPTLSHDMRVLTGERARTYTISWIRKLLTGCFKLLEGYLRISPTASAINGRDKDAKYL